jgi:23S rRNA (cytidine1920-2'-O)/16S rRNA (cytidine1409-2'-O)-methyltransferase
MAGLVRVNGERADKPGRQVPSSAALEIDKPFPPYVSRGGLKLEAALEHFSVDVRDKVLLDVGASTGGFTDCLLQRGARRVIAVDVGFGQLDWKLRQDPRVRLMEKTNIRHLTEEALGETADGAVIDVSFISLRRVIPAVSPLLAPNAFIVALIKPQFEAGRGRVGRGGVVRDPALHQEIIEGMVAFSEGQGWSVRGHLPSPLLGPKGNREFLLYLTRKRAVFRD